MPTLKPFATRVDQKGWRNARIVRDFICLRCKYTWSAVSNQEVVCPKCKKADQMFAEADDDGWTAS